MGRQALSRLIMEATLAIIDENARLRVLVPGEVVARDVEEDDVVMPVLGEIGHLNLPCLHRHAKFESVRGIGEPAFPIVQQQAVGVCGAGNDDVLISVPVHIGQGKALGLVIGVGQVRRGRIDEVGGSIRTVQEQQISCRNDRRVRSMGRFPRIPMRMSGRPSSLTSPTANALP